MNLSQNVKITKVAAAVSAGTEVLTAAIDMQGYDGVLIVVTMATHHDTGNYLKGQQCDTSGGSYADLEGSKVLAEADADVLILDIYKPIDRYIKGSVIRGGTNTALGEIYIIQYKGDKLPEDNDTGIYHTVLVVSPAEGTA
jgi:hypothetical protein